MRFDKSYATILFCSAMLAVAVTEAMARPHQRRHTEASYAAPATASPGQDDRYPVLDVAPAAPKSAAPGRGRRSRSVELGYARESAASSDLVAEARRYLGGNPTGRGSLWCGAFMDLVLKRTGRRGGGNLARAYANYGTRVSGPQVGAIAVMARKGGGHVGVVSGVDSSGNPVIISGNHNNRVEESVYPRGRVITYVVPNG